MGAGRIVAGLVLMGGLLASGGVADAQAAPTLTLSATTASPGDAITVTLTDCPDQPTLSAAEQFKDGIPLLTPADQGGGTWSEEVTVGIADITFSLLDGCGGADLQATVDVENPILVPGPILSPEVRLVFGTDCPDGATPDARVVDSGGTTRTAPPLEVDAEGDWTWDLPTDLPPGPTRVEASCGEVVYEPLAFVVPGTTTPPSTSTTTTTSPTDTGPPTASPAAPVSGAARFTG